MVTKLFRKQGRAQIAFAQIGQHSDDHFARMLLPLRDLNRSPHRRPGRNSNRDAVELVDLFADRTRIGFLHADDFIVDFRVQHLWDETGAEALAGEEAERIVEWLRLRAVGPAIVELRGYAEDIRVAEIRHSSARLKGLTPEQGAAVEALTAGIVNKLLHGPTVALRDAAARPGGLRRSQSRIVRVLRPARGRAA